MQTLARARAWAAVALLTASTASAGEAPRARPDLLVFWSDPQRCISEAVRRDLARETEALFSRWGVALKTSWPDVVDGTQRSVRVVLLNKKRLDADGRKVLGETNVEPLDFPAVWILVPNVKEILEHGGWGDSPPVVARALARVAAHEIGHALGIGHSRKGLMRRGLDATDLTKPWIQASDGLGSALIGALRPGGAQATRGRP